MGITLWTACALVLFAATRFVPAGRPVRWIGELITVLISAMIFGLLATYLDFGGWNELDWRAGVFAFFGAATMVGIVRIAGVAGRASGVGASSHPGVGLRESGVGASSGFAAPASKTQPVKSRATSSPAPETRQPTTASPTPDSRHPTPAK